MRFSPSRLGLLLLILLPAPAIYAQREKLPPEDLEFVEQNWPNAKKTTSGIRYILEKQGSGPLPVPGDLVSVVYSGRLLDGTVFDQSLEPSRPFVFRVGRELVIQGWDDVLQQMKRGERRLVIIPPELGYGTRGQPPRIPRNATLVFEIELVDFKHE